MMESRRCVIAIALMLALAGSLAVAADPIGPERPDLHNLYRIHQANEATIGRICDLPASTLYLDRIKEANLGFLAQLEKLDFDALSASDKIDYLALVTLTNESLNEVARSQKRLADIASLLGNFRDTINALESARWKTLPVDCPAAAAKLAELAEQIKQLRPRVQLDKKQPASQPASAPASQSASGPASNPADANGSVKSSETTPAILITPAQAMFAANQVSALRNALRNWFEFYDGYRPDFGWWTRKPYEEAGKQLDEYAKFLREEIAQVKGKDEDPLVGDPMGAEALAAELRFEWIPYSPDELIDFAEREIAWCEGQMKLAAKDMNLGDDWKAALAKVKLDSSEPGQQDALIASIAREATEFVKTNKLMVVPPLCEDAWRLTMLSPEAIKTVPYAAYGGGLVMVAYPNGDTRQEDKLQIMRGNNRHFMRLVIPHEVIPGHHLQMYYAARNRPAFLHTPFYIEGWAFYTELRFWDMGWARTPEDRIGMLFWHMHRSARVVVTLKYHLGRMTPQEMVTFLTDRIGHEKLGATSEVRRFINDRSVYPAGYLIGGKQLLALHNELVGGGKMSEEQFHSAVLNRGSMPIELLRADLLGLPMTRSAKPSWKFMAGK